MLLSMTGFSSSSCTLKMHGGQTMTLTIELKSINTRFFEALCKLPNSLNHLEVKIINLLQKKLLRGRVFLTVRFESGADTLETVVPSLKIAQGYVTAAKTLQEQLQLAGTLTISDVLMLPDLFVTEKSPLHTEDENVILQYIDKVADALTAARMEEGKALSTDLERIFALCASKINEITTHFQRLMELKKDEVKQQVALSQNGDEKAKVELEELYAALNKIDIHEEITRFNSHLASVKSFLQTPQTEKGKRLDFTLQELLREINTIMAKCSNYDISSLGVDIKVELEKAREQIQNII